MTAPVVTVERIDHIEVFVPDRYEAAEWYRRVLGLEIMRGPVWEWAFNLPNGPLFLANPSGAVKVSLFEGEPLRDHPPIGQMSPASRSMPRASCASGISLMTSVSPTALATA